MTDLEFCIYKQKELCLCFPNWKSVIFLDVDKYKEEILKCLEKYNVQDKSCDIVVKFENKSLIHFIDFPIVGGCGERLNSVDIFPNLKGISDEILKYVIFPFYVDYNLMYGN